MKTLAHSDKNIAQLKHELPGVGLNFGIEFEAKTKPILLEEDKNNAAKAEAHGEANLRPLEARERLRGRAFDCERHRADANEAKGKEVCAARDTHLRKCGDFGEAPAIGLGVNRKFSSAVFRMPESKRPPVVYAHISSPI